MKAAILFLAAITLSTPDNKTLTIDPKDVTTVQEPKQLGDPRHVPGGCWLIMRDGRTVTVIEPCAVVRSLLESEPD